MLLGLCQTGQMLESLSTERQAELGQYMTPPEIAGFMASLLPRLDGPVALLDPGAGRGSLTAAAANHLSNPRLEVSAVEYDPAMIAHLSNTIETLRLHHSSVFRVVAEDFIEHGTKLVRAGHRPYDLAILNPPYKKINNDSPHRRALSLAGIETVNLYSAFVALALNLLKEGGELVAIIPRSFCSGSYYRSFRAQVLSLASIKQIHLFSSRTEAFKEDGVLQENVIIHLQRGGRQSDVILSESAGAPQRETVPLRSVPFQAVVTKGDPDSVIHIPQLDSRELPKAARFLLSEIGLAVSTGPVVDFRLRESLRSEADSESVPLLYPIHFEQGTLAWPRSSKKPNAIAVNQETDRWLLPSGWYCVVRRLSSKEEKRRVIPSVVDPTRLPQTNRVGIENHLNVFHSAKKPLTREVAFGLASFLAHPSVDFFIREFNGHTQVNAGDLRRLKFPSIQDLTRVGQRAMTQPWLDDAASLWENDCT